VREPSPAATLIRKTIDDGEALTELISFRLT
jgi:hypothetical protein